MLKYLPDGTVTSPKGFEAAGIHCGIKKAKKDLALIYSETPCSAAGTFTLNKVKAAPILISKDTLSLRTKVRAVLVNSGNANACTGKEGYDDALFSQHYLASTLNIKENEILISSTGVIGQRMPLPKLLNGIDQIVPFLSEDGGLDAAEAIMTTDLRKKSYAVSVKLSKGEITIGAVCKGSGMIMPNMATMLAFITTDADVETDYLQELLSDAVNISFNKISVDGDTSTNDMVTIMANGVSGITIDKGTEDAGIFFSALSDLCKVMAKSIVGDGEGATKLVTVKIINAKSGRDADMIAKAITISPLVKTAIHGADANWGRIISAAGNSGADFDPAKTGIYFDDLAVLLPGYNTVLDEEKALEILTKDDFTITLDLNDGSYSATWWTCDFSMEYIKINGSYRS